jgi:predicted transcriptional regulator of viral defense system
MRKKAIANPLARLFKQPIFTSKEARSIGVHPSLLAYYAKQGVIKRISRGLYRVETNPSQDFLWTDLVEAVYGVKEGVICLISALAIYELTEEIPRQHWIGVRHGTDARGGPQLKIVRFRNLELGKTTIELDGVIVPIFDRERTIVDSFRLLSKETAIKALKIALTQSGKQRLDLIKLQEYSKKLRVNIDPYLMTVTT